MDTFKPGDECYHKATNKKCVILKKNDDGTFKVRTSDDKEIDYHEVELKHPESVIVHRNPRAYRSGAMSDKITE